MNYLSMVKKSMVALATFGVVIALSYSISLQAREPEYADTGNGVTVYNENSTVNVFCRGGKCQPSPWPRYNKDWGQKAPRASAQKCTIPEGVYRTEEEVIFANTPFYPSISVIKFDSITFVKIGNTYLKPYSRLKANAAKTDYKGQVCSGNRLLIVLEDALFSNQEGDMDALNGDISGVIELVYSEENKALTGEANLSIGSQHPDTAVQVAIQQLTLSLP